MLVAFEKFNHTYHLGICALPGSASAKLTRLRDWHASKAGKRQGLTAFLLCKKPYIAIGTLGVSLKAID